MKFGVFCFYQCCLVLDFYKKTFNSGSKKYIRKSYGSSSPTPAPPPPKKSLGSNSRFVRKRNFGFGSSSSSENQTQFWLLL